MPKINIREIDNTGSSTTNYVENIALIPGMYKKDDVTGLYEDTDSFIAAFEDETAENLKLIKADLGYQMAVILLQLGLPIQYDAFYKTADDITDDALESLYKEYQDKGKYDLRFVTIGGLTHLTGVSTATIIKATTEAIKCAATRNDAVFIGALPESYTKDSEKINLNTSALVDAWVQNNFGDICQTKITRKGRSWTAMNESYGRYGAMYTPNFIIPSITIGDDLVKNLTAPATLDYLACFAVQTKRDWYATAGSVRGVSPLGDIIPLIEYGDADNDIFQVSDGDANKGHIAINTISNIRPYGYIIWGSRTMHPLNVPESGSSTEVQTTASSFLNIRQECIDIKKTLYRAARKYTFEPNSDVLWINYKSEIRPLLEEMRNDEGCKGYQIIKQSSKKKALMVAKVTIVPIEAVEDFDLTLELSDTIEVTE